ncbi:MAG: SGNH/GDSL hydrolase family protein, partial [Acidobacteriota bacterium]
QTRERPRIVRHLQLANPWSGGVRIGFEEMLNARSWRRAATRSGLIVLGTLAGLLLAEVSLRLANRLSSDTETRVSDQEQRVPLGSPGWPLSREGKIAVTPKRTSHRIVVLGDSFTWGDGVEAEEAYPAVLQDLLEQRAELDVEVINWSRPGWNTGRELKSVQPQLPVLDPDLLIIGYCLNDAEPSNRGRLIELRQVMRTAQRQPSDRATVWLYTNTRIGNLVYNFFEYRRLRKAVTDYYQRLYEPERSGWARTCQAFALFNQISKEQQIPVLLVILPIFDSELDHRYAYHNLHLRVAEAATNAGLDVLDLLPSYKGLDGRDLALVPYSNAHPSPLAHRIAAESIYKRLDELATELDLW